MTQVKTRFDCKMFDVANWVACLNGENGPGGTPSHEALSVSPQGALEIFSVVGQPSSLDRNHFSTPTVVLYRRLKQRLGCSLRASLYKVSVVRKGKKATHKCSRAEGSFSGPSKVQGPVLKPKSVGCYGQLDSSSLHKQTRRNSHGGEVRSPVEDHDLVPSLPVNLKSQTHSRCLNVMADLSRSNGVQSTEWSLHPQVFKQICHKWFTPHGDLFATRLNHKVPLYVSPVPDQNAWGIDALNIN